MSRSGYNEDFGSDGDYPLALYRGTVERAAKGKRGQRFFRDLINALDAMPEKRLIKNSLVEADGVCALGAVAQKRSIDVSAIDTEDYEHHQQLSGMLDIAWQLVAEVEYMNDEMWQIGRETPEQRWERMRHWAESNLVSQATSAT